MRIQAFAIGLALAWAAIGGARAATEVQFTIKGGDPTTTFELALSPMVNGTSAPGFSFDVPAVVNGSTLNLVFLSKELGRGGFLADPLFNFSGPQFYNGPESNPTFVPGVYMRLVNGFGGKIDTVTVTKLPDDPPALSVPELSTWVMLLLGFVGLSYAGYRKARTSTTLAA